jgi:hypothetical protein
VKTVPEFSTGGVMASTIAWMDTSADEQRRVRELIALFAQQESRDELGMGQIRDVMSDLLFPGTSVLQTRARYFLLVPWCYKHVSRRGQVNDVNARARNIERSLVEFLIKSDDRGVIGRRAGVHVKNLPSAIFWAGLVAYGILTRDASPEQLTGALRASDDAEELVDRRVGEWHATLPPIPDGFPWSLDDGTSLRPLDLRAQEAEWLQERIVETSRGTLLEHLVQADSAPDPGSGAPWEDRVCLGAPAGPAAVLQYARAFSLIVHGAALMYNLLVAAAYEAAGFDRIQEPVKSYREQYTQWLSRSDSMNRVRDWDLNAFWGLLDSRPNRISRRSRDFIDNMTEIVRSGVADAAFEDSGSQMRVLVSSREQSIKRTQSRLGSNLKLLGAWSGSSGAGALTFRWSQVRGIVTDVQDGLARA